jgi:hypothetical protein
MCGVLRRFVAPPIRIRFPPGPNPGRVGRIAPGCRDGRVLMRERELLTIDLPSTVRELGQRLPALVERGHGRRIQEYDT